MLIIAPSGMLLWLFSVFCSGSRLSDWFMQCIFTENFLMCSCGNVAPGLLRKSRVEFRCVKKVCGNDGGEKLCGGGQ